MLDYAAGIERLRRFFGARGIDTATADDLAQDTWVRWLEAVRRGSLRADGLEPLTRMAFWVLGEHRRRPARCESVCGEFADEMKLIQLQPEGGYRTPRAKVSTRPPEVQDAVRRDRAAGMSMRALAAKYRVPLSSVRRIVVGAAR